MRRFLKFLFYTFLLLLLLAIVAGFALYRASQQKPQFYVEALKAPPPEVREAQREQFEQQAVELRNQALQEGDWRAAFTDDQINAWLADELPKKFPDLLPKEISKPRIKITEKEILAACGYQDQRISTVFSLAMSARLTDQPNEMALTIRSVKAGLAPVPLSRILPMAKERAAKEAPEIRWTTDEDGSPVMLIPLRFADDDSETDIQLKTLELQEGALDFSGSTKLRASEDEEEAPRRGFNPNPE